MRTAIDLAKREVAAPSGLGVAPAVRKHMLSGIVPLFPLLPLYLLAVVWRQPARWIFDEADYVHYASSIARCDFSLEASSQLWFAPVYPLVLAPVFLLQ